jgi:hypothetical protein
MIIGLEVVTTLLVSLLGVTAKNLIISVSLIVTLASGSRSSCPRTYLNSPLLAPLKSGIWETSVSEPKEVPVAERTPAVLKFQHERNRIAFSEAIGARGFERKFGMG